MKRLMVSVVLLAFPLVGVSSGACDSLVPVALKTLLLDRFKGYRLPRESDNLPEDVKYARDHGRSGCLGVEIADFDGDGRADVLLGLTSNDGTGAIVLVAIARGESWMLHELDVWKDDRQRLYVSSLPPGTYDDVGETDGPLEIGAQEHLTCPYALAVFGATESTGVAYCFLKGKWKHVWIQD